MLHPSEVAFFYSEGCEDPSVVNTASLNMRMSNNIKDGSHQIVILFSLYTKSFTLSIVNMAVSAPQAPWHDAPQNAKPPHIQQLWVCTRS